MKTFYGGTFINKETLDDAGIDYPIKLEYYKQINEDEINEKDKAKYGIVIIQTEYINGNINKKTKEIKYLTNDEIQEERILNTFKENQVTPINSEEVITDLFKNIY